MPREVPKVMFNDMNYHILCCSAGTFLIWKLSLVRSDRANSITSVRTIELRNLTLYHSSGRSEHVHIFKVWINAYICTDY